MPANAQVYTEVQMMGDRDVADADFGISTNRDFGDAPNAGYGTTAAGNGPYHFVPGVAADRPIFIGADVTSEADGKASADALADDADDGVYIAAADGSGEVRLADVGGAAMVVGKTYQFRVHVNGPKAAGARVRGWIGQYSTSAATAAWNPTPIVDQGTDGSGDVIFTYTVPSAGLSGVINTFLRFRVSSTANVGPTSVPTAAADPWVVDGEVEDYPAQILNGKIQIGVSTKATPAGPFVITGQGSVIAEGGGSSRATGSLTTTAADSPVWSNRLHAFGTLDQALTLSATTRPAAGNWHISGTAVDCFDGADPTPIPAAVNADGTAVTIPASAVKIQADLRCELSFAPDPLPSASWITVDTPDQIANNSDEHTVTAHVNYAQAPDVPIGGVLVSFTVSHEGLTAPTSDVTVTPSSSSCVTAVDGTCSIKVKSGVADTFDVSAFVPVAGAAAALRNNPQKITFTAESDPKDTLSYFWVDPAASQLVGTGTTYVYVHLADQYDNAISGYDTSMLLWHSLQSLGSKPDGTAFTATGVPGEYRAPIQSDVSGDKEIQVKFGSTSWVTGTVPSKVGPNPNKIAKFHPDVVDITNSAYEVSAGVAGVATGVGDPSKTHTATVYFRDRFGNLTDGNVDSTKAVGRADLPAPNGVSVTGFTATAAPGVYTAYITSTQAGDKPIEVKYDAATLAADKESDGTTDKNTVARFATAVKAGDSFYSVTQGTRFANNTDTHVISVRLFDEIGQPLSSADYEGGIKAWTDPAVAAVAISGFTLVSGNLYTATVKSNRVSGSFTVKAGYGSSVAVAQLAENQFSVDDDLQPAGAPNHRNIQAEFIDEDPDPDQSSFNVTPGSKVVQTGTHTITVTLKDASGSPLSGRAVDLAASTAASLRATGDTSIGGITGFAETGSNTGVYTAAIGSTLAGSKPISISFTKRDGTPMPITNVTIPAGGTVANSAALFEAGEVVLGNSHFEVTTADVVAGNAAWVRAYLFDSWLNPVSGKANELGFPNTADDLGTDPLGSRYYDRFTAVAGSDGVYQGAVISYKTGVKTVTASYGSTRILKVGSNGAGNDKATFISGGVSIPQSWFSVTEGDQPAGTGTHIVNVFLNDQYGNAVSGQRDAVTWATAADLGGKPATTRFAPTAVDGKYEAEIQSNTVGNKEISVTAQLSAAPWSGSLSNRSFNKIARFVPGAVDSAWFWVPGTASNTVNETPHKVRVALLDSVGSLVPDKADQLHAVAAESLGAGGGISNFTEITTGPFAGLYEADISSTLAGDKTISVTMSGMPANYVKLAANADYPGANNNDIARFNAGSPKLVPYSSYKVSEGFKTVGTEQHTVTVFLADNWGNGVEGRAADLSASVTGSGRDGLGTGSITAFSPTATKGEYTATISSTYSGAKNVVANFNNPSDPPNSGAIAPAKKPAPGTGDENTVASFKAGAVSADYSYYSVGTYEVPVPGTHPVSIVLRDAYENLIVGNASRISVSIDTSFPDSGLGTGGVEQAVESAASDYASTYTAKVTSSLIGDKHVLVSVDGTAIDSKKTPSSAAENTIAKFSVTGISFANSWYWVEDGSPAVDQVANGSDYYTIRIHLEDTATNGIAGEAAKLSAQAYLPAGVSIASITDEGSGTYSARVTSVSAGKKDITVSYDGTPLPVRTVGGIAQNKEANFVAGPVSAAKSTYTVSGLSSAVGPAPAPGVALTVSLQDANGNVITDPAQAASIIPTADPAAGVSFSGFAVSGNSFVSTIRSTASGAKDIAVGFGTVASADPLTLAGNKVATFTAGSVKNENSWFQVSENGVLVDSGRHTLTVHLEDEFGNPVSLNPTDLADNLKALAAPSVGVVIGAISETAVKGDYTAQIRSSVSGPKVVTVNYSGPITARDLGGGALANDTALFEAGSVDLTRSSFVVDAATPVVVGNPNGFTVVLRDVNDNPVTGYAGRLSGRVVTGPGSVTVAPFAETATPGTYTAAIATTLVGVRQMVVQHDKDASAGVDLEDLYVLNAGTSAAGNSKAEFVAGAVNYAKSYYTVPSGAVLAGGTLTMDIYLFDDYDNPITGKAGQLFGRAEPAAASVSFPDGVSEVGTTGRYTEKIRSTVIGAYPISVGYGASSPGADLTERVNKIANFQSDVVDPAKSFYWVTQGTRTVGTGAANAHTVYVLARSAADLPITDDAQVTALNVDIDPAALGGGTLSPFAKVVGAGARPGLYSATLTSTVAGSKAVTVLAGTDALVLGGDTVEGTNNTFARFGADVVVPGMSYYYVTSGTFTVGTAKHTVTAVLRDQYGNDVPDRELALSVSTLQSYGSGANVGPEAFAGSGPYTSGFGSTVSGDKVLTVVYTDASSVKHSLPVGPTTPVDLSNRTARFTTDVVDPGNANTKYWVESDLAVAADGVAAHKIWVQLADRFGNLVPGSASAVSAGTDPANILGTGSISSPFTAAELSGGTPGQYWTTVTSTSSGAKQIEAFFLTTTALADRGANSLARFQAVAIDPDYSFFYVSENSVPVQTGQHTITVVAKDASGNAVTGAVGDLNRATSTQSVVAPGDTGPIGGFSGWAETPADSGVYTATVRSTVSGEKPVAVTVNTGAGVESLRVGTAAGQTNGAALFSSGSVDLGHSYYEVADNSIVVSNLAWVRVSLFDVWMNPVVDKAVDLGFPAVAPGTDLGSNPAGASVYAEAFAAVGGSDGVYQGGIRSYKIGAKTVTASYSGTAITRVGPANTGNKVANFISAGVDPAKSWYSVTDDERFAGTGTHYVTAELRDFYDNPVPSQANQMTWDTADDLGGKPKGTAFTATAVDGQYTAPIQSNRVGQKEISLTVQLSAAPWSATLSNRSFNKIARFKPGENVAKAWFWVPNTASKIVSANPVDGHKVRVVLLDGVDALIPGKAASLSASSAQALGAGGGIGGFTEVSTGVYEATVTATEAGDKTISVSLAGNPDGFVALASNADYLGANNNEIARFTEGDPKLTPYSTYKVSEGLKTVASEQHTVTVFLADQFGNGVAGRESALTASVTGTGAAGIGTGVISAFSPTGTKGVYTATISSTLSGEKQVAVNFDNPGDPANSGSVLPAQKEPPASGPENTKARFAAGPVSTTYSYYFVGTYDVQVPGTHPVTVVLRDQYQNLVTGSAGVIDASIDTLFPDSGLGGGGIALPAVEAGTDAYSSTYTVNVSSTLIGDKHVLVSVNGTPVDSKPTPTAAAENTIAKFRTVGVSLANSWYWVEDPSPGVDQVADGVDFYTIRVHLEDTLTNGITGEQAKLAAAAYLPAGVSIAAPFTDDGSGNYSAKVTSTSKGDKNITVTFDGTALLVAKDGAADKNIVASFVSGPVSEAHSTYTVSGFPSVVGPVPAPGVPVSVTLRDVNDNVVTDIAQADKLLPAADPAAGVGFGAWTVSGDSFVSTIHSTAKGDKAITVAYGSALANAPITLDGNGVAHFTEGSVELANSWFEVSENSVPVESGRHTVTIHLEDAFHNPVSLSTTALNSLKALPAPDNGVVVDAIAESATKGTYTAQIRSSVSGPKVITVSYAGQIPRRDLGGGVLANNIALFEAGEVDFTKSTFVVDTATPLVVGTANGFTVVLKDVNGNAVTGHAGRLNGSANTAGVPALSATVGSFVETATAGTYTATISSLKIGIFTGEVKYDKDAGAGAVWENVYVENAGTASAGNSKAAFIAGAPDVAKSYYTVPSGAVLAGGTVTTDIYLIDANDNPITGKAAQLFAASDTAAPSLSFPGGVAEVGTTGHYTVDVSSSLFGDYPITVGFGTAAPGTALRVEANKTAHFADVVDPAKSYFWVTTGSKAVGTAAANAHTVFVLARNAADVPVTDLSQITALNAEIVPPDLGAGTLGAFAPVPGTAGLYSASLTSTAAGAKAVTIKSGTTALLLGGGTVGGTNNRNALFTAGTVDPGKSYYYVTPGTFTVGTAKHTVTAVLLDGYGNDVPNQENALSVSTTDDFGSGANVGPELFRGTGPYTSDFGSTVSGDKVLNVTYKDAAAVAHLLSVGPSTPIDLTNKTARFTTDVVDPTNLKTKYWVESTAEVSADGIETHKVWVQLADRFGNLIPAAAGSVSATSDQSLGTTGGPAGTGGAITSFTGAETAGGTPGQYWADITSTSSGAKQIRAFFQTSTVIADRGPNSIARFSFTEPSAQSFFYVTPTTDVFVETGEAIITVHLVDASGNPVHGKQANLNATAAGGLTAANDTVPIGGISAFAEQGTNTGIYTARVKSTLVGAKPITVTYPSEGLDIRIGNAPADPGANGNGTANFKALEEVDLSESFYWVDVPTVTVGNPVEIHAVLLDKWGNGVGSAGYQIQGSSTETLNGTNTNGSITGFTPDGVAGKYSALVTSYSAGVKPINVAKLTAPSGSLRLGTSADGYGAVNNKNATFKAELIPDPNSLETFFEVSTGDEYVNTGTHTVTVHLADSEGNKISDPMFTAVLDWDTAGDLGSFPKGTAFTQGSAPGTYVADIKSALIGEKTITAAFDDGTLAFNLDARSHNDKASFIVQTDPPDNSKSKYWVTDGEKVVWTTPHTITVALVDAAGNPKTGYASQLTASATEANPFGTGAGIGAFSELLAGGRGTGRYQAEITAKNANAWTINVHFGGTAAGNFDVTVGTAADFPEANNNKVAAFIPDNVDIDNPETKYWVVSDATVPVEGGEHTVIVQLADKWGNPISDQVAKVGASTAPAGILGTGGISSFTDSLTDPGTAQGQYKATITSSLAGEKQITASFDSLAVLSDRGANSKARFSATVPTGKSYFHVNPATELTVEDESATITVHLLNGAGDPVSGLAGKLDASTAASLRGDGDTTIGRISNFTETPAASGIYTATVYSTLAGEKPITVNYDDGTATGLNISVGTATDEDNDTARFKAKRAVDLSKSYFWVDSGAVRAGGSVTIHAYLVDNRGNGITAFGNGVKASTTDNLNGASHNGSISDPFAETGTDGLYTATVTSYAAGEKSIDVKRASDGSALRLGLGSDTPAGNNNRKATFTAQEIPDPDNPETYYEVTDRDEFVGTGEHTVTVHLADEEGNEITDAAYIPMLSWVSLDSLGTAPTTSAFTLGTAAGTYVAPVKSTEAGLKTIEASFAGSFAGAPIAFDLEPKGRNYIAKFIAGTVPKPALSRYWVSDDEKVVWTNPHTVTVVLADEFGNKLKGLASQLRASTDDPASFGGTGTGISTVFTEVTELGVGTGVYTAPVTSKVAHVWDIKVRYGATSAGAFDLTVGSATDPAGKPWPGANGNSLARFIPDIVEETPYSRFWVDPTETTVGTGDSSKVTITAFLADHLGNGVPGQLAKLAKPTTVEPIGAGAISDFAETSVSGYYTATITSTISGDKPIEVRFTNKFGTQVDLALGDAPNNNGAAHFKSDAVASQAYEVSTGAVVVETGNHVVKVTLLDQYLNGVKLQAANIGAATVDDLGTGSIALPFTPVAGVDGVYEAKITSSVNGAKRITAAFNSSNIAATAGVNTIALFDSAGVDPANENTWFEVSTGDVVADGVATHTLTVHLSDHRGNPVSGQLANLSAMSLPVAGVAFATPFEAYSVGADDGFYRTAITSTVDGLKSITARFSGTDLNVRKVAAVEQNRVASFIPGEPTDGQSVYSVSSGEVSVVDGHHTVTVTLRDAKGNLVPGKAANLFPAVGSGLGAGVSFTAFTQTSRGVYESTITSDVKGDKPITVGYGAGASSAIALGHGPHNDIASFVAGGISVSDSSFRVSRGDAVVGVGTHTATLVLRDAKKQPVTLSGSDLLRITALANPSAGVSISGFSPVAGSDGYYTAIVSSNVQGPKTITVHFAGVGPVPLEMDTYGVLENDIASFVSGEVVLGNSSYQVTDHVAQVDIETHTITVRLQDALHQAVPGKSAQLHGTTTEPAGVVVAGFIETATPGTYTAIVSSTKSGIKPIEVGYDHDSLAATPAQPVPVALNPDSSAANKNAVFKEGPVDPTNPNTWYSVAKDSAEVGGSPIVVTAHLSDEFGNAVRGQALLLDGETAADLGTGSISSFTETSVRGTYTANITSTKSGDKQVTVSYGSSGSEADLNVGPAPDNDNSVARFTAGNPDETLSLFWVTGGDVVAGIGHHTVTVRLMDASDNPVPGWAGRLSADTPQSLGLGAIGSFTATGVPGEYSAQIHSTVAGIKTVNALLEHDGLASTAPRLLSARVSAGVAENTASFISDVPDPGKSTYFVTGGDVSVDGGSHIVTAHVVDRNGNPVSGVAVELFGSSLDSLGSGSVTAFAPVAGAVGDYTAIITSSQDGKKRIEVGLGTSAASAAPLTLDGNGLASFVAGGVDVGNSEYWVTPDPVQVVTGRATVTVLLRDAAGNFVTGQGAGINGSSDQPLGYTANQAFSSFSPVAGQPGLYTATLRSRSAGAKTVDVYFGGSRITTVTASRTNVANFTPGEVDPDSEWTFFSVSTGDVKVGAGFHTVNVQLADAEGNLVSGAQAQLSATTAQDLGGGSVGNFIESATTPGTYQAQVTSTKAGLKTMTARFAAGGTLSALRPNGNRIASFIPGDPDLSAAGTNYTVSTGQKVVMASDHLIRVTVVDDQDNRIPGLASQLAASTVDDLGVGLILSFTEELEGDGAYYVAHVSSSRSGGKNITVSLGSDAIQLSGNGNGVAQFVAGAPDWQMSSFSVTTGMVQMGSEHTITVTLADRFGNPVSGAGLRPTLESSADLGRGASIGTLVESAVEGTYTAPIISMLEGAKPVIVRLGVQELDPKGENDVALFGDLTPPPTESAAPPSPGGDKGSKPSGGGLAFTGAQMGGALVAGGLVMWLGGAMLLIAALRRRRNEEDGSEPLGI
jgi:adhesin/invasin